ncbi:DUF58 domain-containing protein [Salinispirillum marinum]|uniref:DUF58 domain-containing protein n=2 Tax=Saccharospirillaceae TaxID=255527 RepID=A0ABV8BFC9_9GAMM
MLQGVSVSLADLASLRGAAAQSWRGLAQQLGAHESRLLGQGMHMREIRPYQPGDDIRHIHWRASARAQGTYSKVYDVEHELPWMLLIALTPSMFFGSRTAFKSVRALDAAARIAWARHAQHDSVGSLLLTAQQHRWHAPTRMASGLLRQLDEWASSSTLTSEHPLSVGHFRQCMGELPRYIKRQQATVVIADFLPHYPWREWIQAMQGIPTTFLQITDALETSLPSQGVFPAMSGGRVHWLTGSAQAQARYGASRQAWFQQLRDQLDPQRHRWVTLDTQQDPDHWQWLMQDQSHDRR